MPTPYAVNKRGDKNLPRVHIPTWLAIENVSEYNDAKLVWPINKNIPTFTVSSINNFIEDSTDYIMVIPDYTTVIADTTNNLYHHTISIGTMPPYLGTIHTYSYENETELESTNSAHVLYFEHAALKSFNFKIKHNHMIDRIGKLYRAEIGTLNQNLSSISGTTLIINSTNESDATVNNTKLTLVEGGK